MKIKVLNLEQVLSIFSTFKLRLNCSRELNLGFMLFIECNIGLQLLIISPFMYKVDNVFYFNCIFRIK